MRVWLTLLLVAFALSARAAEPRVLVEGCQLELVAKEPEIVTPVGVAFDDKGRLLVVESHTHKRTEDYQGLGSDRVRLFADSDGDGTLDSWSTFAEGYRYALNVAVRPDGAVYVVTRGEVHLLRDTNDDGVADEDKTILRLETEEEYPHNALSGIALSDDGLYLGLGENFGVAYCLAGSDGSSFSDHGGAGRIFRCGLEGGDIRPFATGFWNPFSLCLANKRLFAVDNDPDAKPPCRLIDVVEVGDYGFRFEYGRAGVHPLLAWDGELPGTLPMVCGTGEAPTAVVFHRGYLWVTSWGDHRIERYQLSAQADGQLTATLTVVVQGEADFRPTGMAIAPDGSLYFADWVDRSYPVHGKGRIWKLTLPTNMKAQLPAGPVRQPALKPALEELIEKRWLRETEGGQLVEVLREALKSSNPDLRLFAVRWIAEERVTELADEVESLLEAPLASERYYMAVLGAIDWLEGDKKPRHSGINDGLLARELRNPNRPDSAKALALRLTSPDHKELTIERLREFVDSNSSALRLEAVRTLAMCSDQARYDILLELVKDVKLSEELRVEALVGLSAARQEYRELFENLAANESGVLQKEAQRVLRLTGHTRHVDEQTPTVADLPAWEKLLAGSGDADSGRRLFFSPVGPQCSVCHQHQGRGGQVGPELSNLADRNSRAKIIASILDPSREVAPHYQPMILQTVDGKTYVGLRLPKGGDDGKEYYADTAGRKFELASEDIVLRQPSSVSLMPAGLEKSLTVEDLRDLVTFLSSPSGNAN